MWHTPSGRARGFVVSAVDGGWNAEARFRRWISPTAGVDVSVGAATLRVPGARAYGVTSAISVDQGLVGLQARLRAMSGKGEQRLGGSIGLKVGSQASVVTVGVAGVLAALAWASVCSGNGDAIFC
jgi:hypothetical protein